jgi:hypothetical protein
LRDKPIIRRHRFSDLMTNQEAGWREYPTQKNEKTGRKHVQSGLKNSDSHTHVQSPSTATCTGSDQLP